MIRFPNISGWRQTNRSDTLGSLWSSWNLDLTDNLGVTRISPRTLLINDDTANMGVPVAFEFFDGAWWAVCGARVFSNSGTTNGNFSADGSGSAATDYDADESDLELFNGALYATTTDALLKKSTAAGAWSANAQALSTAFPHLLLAFGDRLYVTEAGCKVWSINTSDTMATSGGPPNTTSFVLDLSVYGGSAKNTISCMRATTQYIWIGTLNRSQGKGRVYYWDGAAPTPNGYVELDSAGAMAMVIKDDTPWLVDQNGALLKFNGGTFQEVARLPYDKFKFLDTPYDVDHTDRFIHPNGITIVDDKINILVKNLNFDDGDTYNENFPSGVWEHDEQIGLYHKISLSYHAFTDGSVTDYGQNVLSKVGAIVHAKNNSQASTADGHMLIGAQYYSDASTAKEGIWITNAVDTKQKYGYLVTPKIFSANIKDSWVGLYARIKRLLNASDSIAVKWRTTESTAVVATITWVDTNTFTVATSAFSTAPVVGDEVEILQGTGGGKCAHISAISSGGGNYTIDLDDTFTGVTTGTAKARFQKWNKSNITPSQTEDFLYFPLGPKTPWIQLKICFQFTGKDELYDLILINEKA